MTKLNPEATKSSLQYSVLMSKISLATFGGGCFWCTEAFFRRLKGVHAVTPGYSGGWVKNPTYSAVCSGQTGHAEVIQIEYDPQLISYKTLLEVFFNSHDPTTVNRQGADVGPQYRSVIFYHDESQKVTAEKYIRQLNQKRVFDHQIVTELKPYQIFYQAEDYHQNYFDKNPDVPYCQLIIAPKLAKFQKRFESKL